MKTSTKKFKFLAITAIAFALSMNNFTISKAIAKNSTNLNVAIVDVQKIIENSPEITALKVERKNVLTDLQTFVEKAKADVSKETNVARKTTLEESYNKELNLRKDTIDKEYVKKISDVDKSITALIKIKASSYDLVLTKSSVLNGGTDITADIIKGLT